jgi:hypothetical protein
MQKRGVMEGNGREWRKDAKEKKRKIINNKFK